MAKLLPTIIIIPSEGGKAITTKQGKQDQEVGEEKRQFGNKNQTRKQKENRDGKKGKGNTEKEGEKDHIRP